LCADLATHWNQGISEAESVLEKLGLPMSFSVYFCDWKKRGVDLMRPIEGKKYPGISAEVDRSLDDLVASDSTSVEEVDLHGHHEFRLYRGKEELEKELVAITAALKAGYSVWIDLGERMVHKKTIIRLFSNPTLDLDYNKSHDRLIRVRCFSIGGDKRNRTSGPTIRELPTDSVFKLDDLFATLVSINGAGVSLAVAKCTSIKSASDRFRCVPLDELPLQDSSYEVSGQILTLLPFQTAPAPDDIENIKLRWAWNGDFASLDKYDPRQKCNQVAVRTTERVQNLSFTVNGSLVRPLKSSERCETALEELPDPFPHLECSRTLERTWVFTEETLVLLENELHHRIKSCNLNNDPEGDLRFRIPMFGPARSGSTFPYTIALGMSSNDQYFMCGKTNVQK
jgi:hypothetical protein